MTREEFKNIFDNHFDSVRNYIYYRSGDEELATDIAQEAFLRIWEKQINHSPDKTVGLLYKIAGDLFISRYRHQKVAQNYAMKTRPPDESLSPEDELRFKELKTRYETALKEMPEKQRIVFLMSRMEEMKYHEIATRLELSVKSVEKRMKHALLYLRKALGN